jgi:phosphoglycerate kinase
MNDGIGNTDLSLEPFLINDIKNSKYSAFDIGGQSLDILFKLIKDANIIFWNGSLGVIEHEIYKQGSLKLIDFLQQLNEKTIIIGGGETASLIDNKCGNIYVSTGGGALLEYLEKKLMNNINLIGLELYT